MTTGYGGSTEFDLDDLDDLLNSGVRPDPRADVVVGRRPALADPVAVGHALPLDGQASSMPGTGAVSTLVGRTLRTTAPFVTADLLSLALSGLIAHGVLWLFDAPAAEALLAVAPIALLPLVVAYWFSGLYSEIWVHPLVEMRQLARLNTVGLLSAAAGGILSPPFPLWCVAAWLATFALVPLFRGAARRLCAGCRWWGYPTLVIGSGDGTDALGRTLLKANRSGLRPVLLTDPDGDRCASVLRQVNDPATLESMIRAESIHHAVIFLPEFSTARLAKLVDRYSSLIPHLLVLSDPSTLPALWGASRNCGGLSGIEVRNRLLLKTLQSVKRCIDLSLALATVTLGSPFLLAIAAAVKLTGRGPVFYGHTRIGQNGRPFKAWKFRTMYVDGDVILREHLARSPEARAEWDRDQKLRRDPRITWAGRFLRTTSLDELPQVWNVLRGDMSLVGPRPIVAAEVFRYGEAFRHYITVKPGITGLWQVSGRNDVDYDDRVRLDSFYVQHWSPWLDVYIIAKTGVALAQRSGAY